MEQVVARLGFPRDRIRIVPIATDLPERLPEGGGPAGGTVRFVACGRFVEKKGHELAIRAFAEVRHALPRESTLEVVGTGPLEKRLRGVAESLGLGTSIVWHGSLPRIAFRDLLESATLFLAPSVTAANGDSEGGAPTTILDAQAVGTIVVGSTHADIPFLIEDGQTGYLASEADLGSLVETINRALANRSRWPEIRERAGAQVRDRHSANAVRARLEGVYSEVIE
jgi:colanic acid/amylovoran biosynthesis glycosyltransferase